MKAKKRFSGEPGAGATAVVTSIFDIFGVDGDGPLDVVEEIDLLSELAATCPFTGSGEGEVVVSD